MLFIVQFHNIIYSYHSKKMVNRIIRYKILITLRILKNSRPGKLKNKTK